MSDKTSSGFEPTERVLTTDKGRTLLLRPLSTMEGIRLFKALGKNSSNDRYVNSIALAIAVREIDGVKQPFPNTEADAEATASRVGDDGYRAINKDAEERAEGVDDAAQSMVDTAKN